VRGKRKGKPFALAFKGGRGYCPLLHARLGRRKKREEERDRSRSRALKGRRKREREVSFLDLNRPVVKKKKRGDGDIVRR